MKTEKAEKILTDVQIYLKERSRYRNYEIANHSYKEICSAIKTTLKKESSN